MSKNKNLQRIPTIVNLNRLRKLVASECVIGELPVGIEALKELRELRLPKNRLKEIPAVFGDLLRLESVDLSNNGLQRLPITLGHLTRIQEWNVKGNTIEYPPNDLSQEWKSLFQFSTDLLKGNQKCNFVKLIIVI